MFPRVLAIATLAVALLAVSAVPAAAAVHGPLVPMAVFGIDFPSVKEIVGDVVKFFFSTLLDALVPDWLRDGSVRVIRRLVTIPNPTDARVWPTLARLSEGMRWIALPLLSLAVVASWVQQWLRETTGRPGSMAVVLPRTVLAALLLVAYPTLVANAVALVNSITNAMLSLPAVQDGLQRTVGLVFAGTLLSGSGVLLALLGIAAVVLTVGLFMLSVGLLVIFSVAFVSAPLAIACSVLDETRGVWTAWRFTLLSAALIPVGWCVLFATAGAFMLDMTHWSGGVAGTIGSRFVGVFGALIVLGLAVRWPLILWSSIRAHLGGALVSVGRTAAGGRGMVAGAGGRTARAALQRTGLRAGDAVAGALGATRARALTSARMALSDGARLAARVPGVGSASAAVGAAGAASPARPTPAAAARAAKRGTQHARAHGRAAAHAAHSAYAAGASAPQAAAAGVAVALSQPARSRSAAHETGSREGRSPRERTGPPSPRRTSPGPRTTWSASTRRQPDAAAVASLRTGTGPATRTRAITSTRPDRQGDAGGAAGSRRPGRSVASPGRVPAPATAARSTGPVARPPASAPGPTAAKRPAMPSSAPPRRRAPQSGTAPPSSGRRGDRASGRTRRKGG